MPRFFLITLLIFFTPLHAHAQEGGFESSYIEVLDEEDQSDLAEMLKLQEVIPSAEKNCYTFKKNKKECRCDNASLYNEYNKLFDSLIGRHPDWDRKTLKYNFFWDGVTYEGKDETESFHIFTYGFSADACSGEDDEDWEY